FIHGQFLVYNLDKTIHDNFGLIFELVCSQRNSNVKFSRLLTIVTMRKTYIYSNFKKPIMKKYFLIALMAIFTFQVDTLIAQETPQNGPNFPKIDASPMDLAIYRDANEEALARVIYSRPQKRDREVFGKLVPYGQVWRTGANEATELTLYKDMTVAD